MPTLQDSLTAVFQQIGADIQSLRTHTAVAPATVRYIGQLSGGASAELAWDLSIQTPRDTGCAYSVSQAGWFRLGEEPAFYAPAHTTLIFNPAGLVEVVNGAHLGETSDFIAGLNNAYSR